METQAGGGREKERHKEGAKERKRARRRDREGARKERGTQRGTTIPNVKEPWKSLLLPPTDFPRARRLGQQCCPALGQRLPAAAQQLAIRVPWPSLGLGAARFQVLLGILQRGDVSLEEINTTQLSTARIYYKRFEV